MDRPLLFEPGTARRYSNPGYDLLGLIVESVDGASLEDGLRRRVNEPLALRETSFSRRDDAMIPRGYAETGVGLLIDVTASDLANVNPFSLSGGLVSTVAEVGSFWRALFSQRLIRAGSIERMQQDRGLFDVDLPGGKRAFCHPGALAGQSTWALYVPADDAVVVFPITRNGSRSQLDSIAAFLD